MFKRHGISPTRPAVVAALAGLLSLALGVSFSRDLDTSSLPSASAARLGRLPRVILWAWESPEDLSFINPQDIGVSYLAETIYLRGEDAVVRPRLQPLKVPPQTALLACARIESDFVHPPALAPVQRARAAAAIARLVDNSRVVAIQVDFDARTSERAFYRELLRDLRHLIPPSMPLSMTALASWCVGDNWIEGLPVNEAVPMLFRMGPDRGEIHRYLEGGKDFRSAACRQSVGLAAGESLPSFPAGRRVYLFHSGTWSPENVRNAYEEVRR